MDSSPSPAPSIPIPPSPPRDLDKPRRNLVTPTNSLILLLPQNLFSPSFLPLLQAHFASYGPVAAWTPLERLGRVLVVYQDVDSSVAARREMDGFVWEEDEDDPVHPYPAAGSLPLSSEDPHSATADSQRASEPLPLRAFFGPSLSLPLASLHSTLLSVPALSRNFLISPPGSPPIGWEQTLEEAPNRVALPHHDDEVGDGTPAGWVDELARALRYLSVQSGGDADDLAVDDQEDGGDSPSTHTLISAEPTRERPSVTLSAPLSEALPVLGAPTPPVGATRITAVKATIESMLGRRKSFGELAPVPRTIIPTARPPTDDERPFQF